MLLTPYKKVSESLIGFRTLLFLCELEREIVLRKRSAHIVRGRHRSASRSCIASCRLGIVISTLLRCCRRSGISCSTSHCTSILSCLSGRFYTPCSDVSVPSSVVFTAAQVEGNLDLVADLVLVQFPDLVISPDIHTDLCREVSFLILEYELLL